MKTFKTRPCDYEVAVIWTINTACQRLLSVFGLHYAIIIKNTSKVSCKTSSHAAIQAKV